MSVIIKNIRKPENCEDCYKFGRRISSETIECSVDTGWAYESNHYIRSDCPLVELPEKHGRLIDADEFIELLGKDYKYSHEKYKISNDTVKMLITKMYELLINEIKQRPTVAESEE